MVNQNRSPLSKNKNIIFILIPPAILCIAGLVYTFYVYRLPSRYQSVDRLQIVANKTISFPVDEQLLRAAFSQFPIPNTDTMMKSRVVAGIVPHHALASPMIAEFFSEIKKRQFVKRFIIIGPNHPDAGIAHAISARVEWQSLAGNVKTDPYVSVLLKNGLVQENNQVMAGEHSIYTLVPFIDHYFPDATIVPIIISSNQLLEESVRLVAQLEQFLDNDTVVVASVDFSHYLASDIAKQKDVEMEQFIMTKQYEKISTLQSDYLDSPQSIITTLLLAEKQHADPLVVRHSTSADFVGRDVENSTSYFTILFTTSTNYRLTAYTLPALSSEI